MQFVERLWRSSSRATLWKGASAPLGKARVADIYEGRVTSWREVGGLERRTAFFNKEPRRGTWEVFAHWVYGVPILIVASVHDHRVAGAWSACCRQADSRLLSVTCGPVS